MAKREFFGEVYKIVKKIPPGKVATYGQIAEMLGSPRAARTVGWALHANQDKDAPCHRVVDRNGRLAPNFAFSAKGGDGSAEQRRRLEAEGVKFKDERYVDLDLHQVESSKLRV